ncbi:MAG: HD domain-containing protein [Gemmatimonadaceae bacterium]|nr:HD domain-containing protein [Gemmatimonadaceae bacterium]
MAAGFLKTKVGRRFLAVNLLTAFVPVALVIAVSFHFVNAELRHQAETRVVRLGRTLGLGTLSYLTSLSWQLREGVDSTNAARFFEQVTLDDARAAGTPVPTGPAATPPPAPLTDAERTHLAGGRPLVRLAPAPEGQRVLLARARLPWNDQAQPVQWALLRSEALFGESDESVTAEDAVACIFDTRTLAVIHCTDGATPAQRDLMTARARRGGIEHDSIGRDGVFTSARDIYLRHEYAAAEWRTVVLQPESASFAAARVFRNTFLGLAAAVLALIFAVSHAQIRRTTEPLARLQDGTRRLEAGDFGTPVVVQGDDEYAQVATSFNHMASSLHQTLQRLDALQAGTVLAFARAIDANSPWTAGHSERVTTVALEIGRTLHLSAADLDTLRRGGLLHDIGKIAVPPEILDKARRLSDEEWVVMRRHPVVGCEILAPIPAFADTLPIVRWHHERMDGTGYPDQLRGEEIPWLARIAAVADVFDALASHRPYRAGLSTREACDIIQRSSGTHFDPRVVHAFMDAVAAGRITAEASADASSQLAATVARAREAVAASA